MRVKTYLDMDVVEAARKRLIGIFTNRCPITVSFSGGKDSLVLLTLVLELKREGLIDCSNLTVIYVDEEAMYPDVIEGIENYRSICLQEGIKFIWYAMEMRHFNSYNSLQDDLSFVMFDRFKADRWVRNPPAFATRDDPMLKPRLDQYQEFCSRKGKGGIDIIGDRESESVQRMFFMSRNKNQNGIFRGQVAYPIYDWTDNDVWLFIKKHHVPFPEVYIRLYQVGTPRNRMRVSYFFGLDSARCLSDIAMTYPGMMDAILKREPNAYLCSLYWDSEMFRRKTSTRKELEGKKDPVMVRNHVMQLLSDIPKNFNTVNKREMPYRYRRFILKFSPFFVDKDWQEIEEAIIAGDLNGRVLRGLMTTVMKHASDTAKKEGREYVKKSQ